MDSRGDTSHESCPELILAEQRLPLDLVDASEPPMFTDVALVAPDLLPAPYRRLLVHNNSMTLTLERHFGSSLVLKCLSHRCADGWYWRRVLLLREHDRLPIEVAALRIRVDQFSEAVRQRILEGVVPLGRLLLENRIDYTTYFLHAFAVRGTAQLRRLAGVTSGGVLYGRRAMLRQGGQPFADVVELLTPSVSGRSQLTDVAGTGRSVAMP